jgi:hypothetical protein
MSAEETEVTKSNLRERGVCRAPFVLRRDYGFWQSGLSRFSTVCSSRAPDLNLTEIP